MVKPKPKVDKEASEKDTIRKSIVGRLVLSKYICSNCKAPVLESWTKCERCGSTKAEEIEFPKVEKDEKEKEE